MLSAQTLRTRLGIDSESAKKLAAYEELLYECRATREVINEVAGLYSVP